MLSTLYAAIARRRREWYAVRPHARRRLRRPVISIGNIAAGGRGKTPFTATVARLLLEMGETPAILSRGYARTDPVDGAVVVRDAQGIRADLARSGDEPLMLARQLDGTIVMAGADRYISGRLAEHHLGATVHLLDDGFQHFALDRDVDIVLVSARDLAGARTLPAGPLREPPDVLIAADAIVCLDAEATIDIPDVPVFRATRSTGLVVFDETGPASPAAGAAVIAVAGIANPAQFFEAVTRAGWQVAATRTFRDHHPFTREDLTRIASDVASTNATAVLTTEKDYVRLLPHRPFPVAVGWLPLTISPEPAGEFRRWLAVAIGAARDIVIA
ncbi:MAG: tetraacyldisaccharide 4'-kinase [Acidobacteria bacterium]|nr:tetraacyldisaccharide 4'-kinase [Acidobacteriota bacterium]